MKDLVLAVRDLEADLAICEAATPGPWAADDNHVMQDIYDKDDFRMIVCKTASRFNGFKNVIRFIAEARTGWPYAIRRAMESEKEMNRLRDELRIFQEQERGSRSCWD